MWRTGSDNMINILLLYEVTGFPEGKLIPSSSWIGDKEIPSYEPADNLLKFFFRCFSKTCRRKIFGIFAVQGEIISRPGSYYLNINGNIIIKRNVFKWISGIFRLYGEDYRKPSR